MVNNTALLIGIIKQLFEDKIIDREQYNNMIRYITKKAERRFI